MAFAAKGVDRGFEPHEDACREARRHPVGAAWARVGLHDRDGDAKRQRGEHRRQRRVTAHGDHESGPSLPQDTPCAERRGNQGCHRRDPRQRALADRLATRECYELEARFGNESRF